MKIFELLVDLVLAAGEFVLTYPFEILGVAAAAWAAIYTNDVMRRLDDRQQGAIGGPATKAAGLLAVMLLSIGSRGYGTNLPYVLALAVLLFPIAWRIWNGKRVFRDTASNPSLVLVGVGATLVGVLWMVELAVHGPDGTVATTPWATTLMKTAAAAGALAMAVIQGVRGLLPVRGAFHRTSLQRWVDESIKGDAHRTPEKSSTEPRAPSAAHPAGTLTAAVPDPVTPKPVDSQLLLAEISTLASASSGTERYALYDLPIEQLCGQIAAGADRLLDDPGGFVPTAKAANPDAPVAAGAAASRPAAPEGPVGAVAPPPVTATASLSAADLLACLAGSRADVSDYVRLAGARKAPASEDGREYMRLRGNLSQRIQRNVDRLQIDTTFWWRRLLRGVAFIICAVVGRAKLGDPIAAALCGIAGGFVATFARDLVAIVEKARR